MARAAGPAFEVGDSEPGDSKVGNSANGVVIVETVRLKPNPVLRSTTWDDPKLYFA